MPSPQIPFGDLNRAPEPKPSAEPDGFEGEPAMVLTYPVNKEIWRTESKYESVT